MSESGAAANRLGSGGIPDLGRIGSRIAVRPSAPQSSADLGQLFRPVLIMLDRVKCGGIILSSVGDVVCSNMTADAILEIPAAAKIGARDDQLRALLRLGNKRFSIDEDFWVLLDRTLHRPLAIHSQPLGSAHDPNEYALLVLVDLAQSPEPDVKVLKRVFDLTTAEAHVARALARGQSPGEIAVQRGCSMKTIRTQLAAVFQKTQTSRQGELVALLSRMALLP